MGESQRLLWVIGSVALLVVVVLAGGLYWLRPQTPSAGGDVAQTRAFDPYEFVRSGEAAPGLLQPEGTDAASQPGSLGLGIGATATQLQSGTPQIATSAGDGSVSIQRQITSVAPSPPLPRSPTVSGAAVTPSGGAGVTRLAPTVDGSASTAAAPRTAAPVDISTNIQYWIQVASFTSRGRADAVDRQLRDSGVASRITTRSAGDSLFYRVRVGPYANHREAEKFLGWIKSVDELSASYISRVY